MSWTKKIWQRNLNFHPNNKILSNNFKTKTNKKKNKKK